MTKNNKNNQNKKNKKNTKDKKNKKNKKKEQEQDSAVRDRHHCSDACLHIRPRSVLVSPNQWLASLLHEGAEFENPVTDNDEV